MVQDVLNHWNFKTWNQLLADDVVLNMRLGTATKDSAGDAVLLGMKVEYTGRDAVKKALREIYGDLRKDFQITTEVVHGPERRAVGRIGGNAERQGSSHPADRRSYDVQSGGQNRTRGDVLGRCSCHGRGTTDCCSQVGHWASFCPERVTSSQLTDRRS